MTLKGMRKADQQMVLDTLGMDRVPSTTRGEAASASGAAAAAVAAATTATTAAATALPESGPLGSARLTANIPNFETNTRYIVPALFFAVFSCAVGCASIKVAYSTSAVPGFHCDNLNMSRQLVLLSGRQLLSMTNILSLKGE